MSSSDLHGYSNAYASTLACIRTHIYKNKNKIFKIACPSWVFLLAHFCWGSWNKSSPGLSCGLVSGKPCSKPLSFLRPGKRHLSTSLCNHPFAVLKLLQPHLLILATMGLQFRLSFCELPKDRINSWARLSFSDQKVQTAYMIPPPKYQGINKRCSEFLPPPHFLGH